MAKATVRGVLHRIRRAYKEATAEAIQQVRVPAEKALREWVAEKYPNLRARRYEGAQGGRRGEGWNARSTSANVEIARDFAKLRDRARDLGRNDPTAARIREAHAVFAVGTGIVPKSATNDAKLDKYIDEQFAKWAKKCSADGMWSLYALQRQAARAMKESGECLAREVPVPMGDGLDVPLRIDLLEGDFLDHTATGMVAGVGPLEPGHYIYQGIEFNERGKRMAYWLWRQHPGDSTIDPRGVRLDRVRVPVDECAHLYDPTRPGQVRGVTDLAPVMWTLKQTSLYLDAELERKGTEALVTAISRTSQPGGAFGDAETETDSDGVTRQIATMEPGSILNIRDSEDVTFNHPTATDPSSAIEGMDRRVASGVGQPYELISSNLKGVNYSSIRYGNIPFRGSIAAWQEAIMIGLFCDWVWERWTRAAIAAGVLKPRKCGYPVKWATPRWEEVDRLKEALADAAEIRNGLRSYPDVLASRGESWREVLDEAMAWLKELDLRALSFDCDPRHANGAAPTLGADSGYLDPAADPADSRRTERRWRANPAWSMRGEACNRGRNDELRDWMAPGVLATATARTITMTVAMTTHRPSTMV
jgi:lambda family phage portal protein